MARVTVEDCLDFVSNRFELVQLAAKRARLIANGQAPLVEEDNDKPTVLALREIAAGLMNEEKLKELELEEITLDHINTADLTRTFEKNGCLEILNI